MLDRSRVDIKMGDYGTAPAIALDDPLILPRVQMYRRQFSQRMVALDKNLVRHKIPAGEYYISRKIDGEFTVIVVDGDDIVSVNPYGTVRVGLALLDEAHKRLKKAKIKKGMFLGELYVERPDGKRPRVHDLVRVARRPGSEEDVDTLRMAMLDILELNGEETSGIYAERFGKLKEIFGGGEYVDVVETEVGKDAKGILKYFEKWVEKEGEEGIVARSDTVGTYKIKPRHSIDAAVIGFAEGTEDRAGMLHDLLLALMRPDGMFQVFGRVGGGFSEEQRRNFLSDLLEMKAESEYAEINVDRVAYQMVKPDWIVEISALDFVAQTTRGATIDRMVLEWDAKAETWCIVRRLPLVSVIAPQFVRIRDDKKADVHDIRLAQVTDIVDVAMADKDARELKLPKSKIIKRRLATKVLKGATMVRKIILWQTNKESASDEWPAFVVHLTDFSPNRKDPLKRDIRVSNDKEQIEQLFQEMEEANFVRGWEVVE